ncbi:hypothetical protein [Bacillus sp. AK128]
MSIVNYLGCNFVLPVDVSDEKVSFEEGFLEDQDRKMVKKHFTTNNIYEVYTDLTVGISFIADNHDFYFKKGDKEEAKESFLNLCSFLNRYLKDGEYCEFYTCWHGEEEEQRDHNFDQTIYLNNIDINNVSIMERTLLVIRKK